MTKALNVKLFAGALSAFALATGAWAQPSIERTVKVAPGGLYEIVHNSGDNDVYVAATGPRGGSEAAVVRLDGATLESEGRIDVASSPLYGLAVNGRTQRLYGTDTRSGAVSTIDLRTGAVVGSVTHGEGAHVRQLVVDEAADKIYVSVVGGYRGGEAPSQIWVIDGATNRLERTIEIAGISLTGLAHDPAGHRLFSTGMTSNDVVVIDLATGNVAARWPTGGDNAINVAFDAAGNRLFVANQGSGELSVLNATDGTLIRKIATGEGALSVAHNPANNQIYVANRRAGTLSVVDGGNYELLANLPVGSAPQTIAIDRATNAVYVTSKTRPQPRRPAAAPAGGQAAGDERPARAPRAEGAAAPAAPAAAPVAPRPAPQDDPTGDVVTLVRP